jgi:cyclohexyl-isocyanide hydratase
METRQIVVIERLQQAPEPPFNSGTPATAPPEILAAARATIREITEARLATAKRIAARLGVDT